MRKEKSRHIISSYKEIVKQGFYKINKPVSFQELCWTTTRITVLTSWQMFTINLKDKTAERDLSYLAVQRQT